MHEAHGTLAISVGDHAQPTLRVSMLTSPETLPGNESLTSDEHTALVRAALDAAYAAVPERFQTATLAVTTENTEVTELR
ncbi:glutamine synthetase adenylyltransferase [Streptomyces sp. NBRC 110611]|uniref:hypothetical protein n=1 Tax=Streptomyces sp. NBRC 110611 TaxID=1621259 RepID=UPI00082CD7BA|nr:hypothetical protein [Streptomyces sp. NBRC 110611]GAU67695.1 glutamine synthetase adenylyltransferase [Streptomyces sp. NBRC 110611]